MSIALIPCKESDLPKVAEMAAKIWHAYYIEIISKKQIDYMLDKFYNQNAMLEQIKQGHRFYFICKNEQPIGFISISLKDNSEAFIHKFYISNDHRECGIGSKTMDLIIDMYKTSHSLDALQFKLTVNRQNYRAINFYFKNGFLIEKIEDFDIGNGYFMNDFVMQKKCVFN